METRRWTNPSQPQTLQIAVFLLYINAVLDILFGALFSLQGVLMAAGGVAAGFGIANEKRWGYALGLVVAVLRVIFYGFGVINLMFEIALVALLLHPQSREYQRIWFS
jgi:hypothetical protein